MDYVEVRSKVVEVIRIEPCAVIGSRWAKNMKLAETENRRWIIIRVSAA